MSVNGWLAVICGSVCSPPSPNVSWDWLLSSTCDPEKVEWAV